MILVATPRNLAVSWLQYQDIDNAACLDGSDPSSPVSFYVLLQQDQNEFSYRSIFDLYHAIRSCSVAVGDAADGYIKDAGPDW